MIQSKKNKPASQFIFWIVRTKLRENKVSKMYKHHDSWNRQNCNTVRSSVLKVPKHNKVAPTQNTVIWQSYERQCFKWNPIKYISATHDCSLTVCTLLPFSQPLQRGTKGSSTSTLRSVKLPKPGARSARSPGLPLRAVPTAYSPCRATLGDFLPLPLHLRTMRENGEQFQH